MCIKGNETLDHLGIDVDWGAAESDDAIYKGKDIH